MWTAQAKWLEWLFALRHALVKPFGLATPKGDEHNTRKRLADCIRNGGTVKNFSIVAKTSEETVMLVTDKHLDAYCAVRVEVTSDSRQMASLFTIVKYNNRLGKIYFTLIKPFHGMIVRNFLRNNCPKGADIK